jgi:hypothetical protein
LSRFFLHYNNPIETISLSTIPNKHSVKGDIN